MDCTGIIAVTVILGTLRKLQPIRVKKGTNLAILRDEIGRFSEDIVYFISAGWWVFSMVKRGRVLWTCSRVGCMLLGFHSVMVGFNTVYFEPHLVFMASFFDTQAQINLATPALIPFQARACGG